MGTFFSLSKSATSTALGMSELALLLFGLLLVVGLIGEYAKAEHWKRHVRVFEMFVIIGVAGELLADGGIFLFSGHLQTIADLEIANLTKEAGNAKESAHEAASAAQRAREQSDKTTVSASNALALARGARQEADSFEKDILFAKKQAADAESHLADALQRAADANRIAEEERLKRVQIEERMKPRSLKPSPQAISALKAFKRTEYTFSSVFPDEESIVLLKQLDSILLSAGWTRVKPPHAYPAINVYGQEQDFAVASGLRSGIKISVDSENSLATLQAIPVGELPAPTGAAVVLAMELTASLIPPQDNGVKANVEAGKSMTVRIEIGRKP